MNGYSMITAIVRRDQDQDYIDFSSETAQVWF